jgi:phage protein D
MKPLYKIEANNIDVTANIRGRLISASIVDNEGVVSDSFEMVLDDRDNAIILPTFGAEIKVWLGYQSTGLEYMGLYVFDGDIRFSGPPEQITLRATAAHVGNSSTRSDMTSLLKEKKTRSWAGVWPGKIIEAIAGEAGYEARIFDFLMQEKEPPHYDQTGESDLNFLKRLGDEFGAIVKPVGGYLVFAPKEKINSFTGKTIGVVSLDKKQLSSWESQWSERGRFPTVAAFWQDLNSGERKRETAGSGDQPVSLVQGNCRDQYAAQRAAQIELDRINRGHRTAVFSMPGRTDLSTSNRIRIQNLRPEYDINWSITKATHSFSDSGYKTTIECEALDAEVSE